MAKQGNNTYFIIDPPENNLQNTKPTQILKKRLYKPKTMRNHSKSQKNIKYHGNKTRITQKIEKNKIIKNQKETSEDNRQNPPLDLILPRIQRNL